MRSDDTMQNGARRQNDFLWGVATSAYQAEGGYNGDGQPKTNWAAAEEASHVAPLGNAAEFWTRFRDDFALCRRLGLNAFRLSIEWSRVQPTLVNRESAPPLFDYAALDHYAEMLAECRRAGLEPVVTLHHFVHPAWLGPDPWLRPETADLFARFVDETLRYLNSALIGVHGLPPIHYYLTVNEPNMLVLNTYFGHQFPSAERAGLPRMTAAFSQLFRAHIFAYNRVHNIYRELDWPTPAVSVNNHCCDLYFSDKLWLDVLSLRVAGIERDEVDSHLRTQARRFAGDFKNAPIPLNRDLAYRMGGVFKFAAAAIGRRFLESRRWQSLLDAIYASPRAKLMDYLALDYYDPFTAHVLRLPVWGDHEFPKKSFRSRMMNAVTSKWWEWRVLPRGLRFFCQNYYEQFQLPILIAENGMALRRPCGATEAQRPDRMTRSQFLRLHLHEVDRIRQSEIPLLGYFHWSLFDNYEWGTYTARFGLFSIDFAEGAERMAEDHIGDRPSETYARLISESRRFESAARTAAG